MGLVKRLLASFSIFAGLFLFSGTAFAASADLVTNQNVSPIQGPAGGTFTYTLQTTNAGPSTATGVSITDTLPSGAHFVGVTSSTGTCSQSGGVVTCALPDILAGSTGVTTTIQVILPTDGVYTNTVSGTTTSTDPNPSNNTNIVKTTTAYAAADLQMNATASSTTVVAGQPYTYNLSVTNKGPDAVASGGQIFIAFQVPSGATVTQLPAGAGWTCTPNTGYPLSTGTITCSAAPLANGATSSILTAPVVANQTGAVAAAFDASATDGNGNPMPDGNSSNNSAPVTVTVSDGSDVSITGSATPNPVGLGGTVTYTLTPRFNGGIPPGSTGSKTITVVSTLAAGLTYVPGSANGNGWTCSAAGQVITCTRPGPYTGGNFTNMPQITYQATTSQTGTLANAVSISAPETDPVPANNNATINVNSSNAADLSIQKTASLNPVVPGQAFNYFLRIKNNGPLAVATGQTITATDNIPAGVTLTGAPSGSGWSCIPSGGAGPVTVTCTRLGPLASGSFAPTISLPVILSGAGSVSNTASVALTGTGPVDDVPGNNTSTVGVTASSTSADLSITKSASGNVTAGQPLTYTITVSNQGPDPSTNVTMTDVLDNLITAGGLQSITTSQGTCTPSAPANGPSQTVRCNLGTLGNGASATIQITVLPTIAVTGTRSNTATIYSPDVGDPIQTNNSATATSQVTAVVDLALAKTATPSSVPAGAPLTYQVTAKNNGPSSAQNVSMSDALPANATFIKVVNVSNGGTCPTQPAAGAPGGTLTCVWPSIPSGSQYTVTYQIRPTTAGSSVTNHATVSTSTQEPNTTNNSATTTTPVTAAVLDLSITKSHTPDPVPLGGTTTYTIVVRNAGPSQDTGVVMTDTLPDATQPQSAVFSYQGGLTVDHGGTCTTPVVGATSGQVVCTFPTLAQGETATITYQAKAESITQAGALSGTEISQAGVVGQLTETTLANNSVLDYTTAFRVASNADLAVTKTLTSPASGYLYPGADAVYQITVTNNGPATSKGAQLMDTLPSNLQFVSATGGCLLNAGTVMCDLGTMAAGSSKSFTVTTKVASTYNGAAPIVNQAAVDAPGDPNSGNNSASATSKVAKAQPIPTVSEWGMLIMGLAMLLTGVWYSRRRSA